MPLPSPTQGAKEVYETGVRLFLIVVLLCAGGEFIVRGPMRFVRAASFNDFISPYIQTRNWMGGEDPYSPANLARNWPPEAEHYDFLSRDLADGTLVLKRGIPTAYPVSAFVLLAPVAALPWHIAQPLWLAITVLAFAGATASLVSLAKISSGHAILFVAIALALAPFHTALAAGSIVTVSAGASAAAMWAASRRHEVLAAVLLGVAVSLKPQIGLPFCFFYLVRRRWRIAAVSAAVAALALLLGAGRCALSGTPWLENYLYDNRILFAPGSLGDFTEGNPIRFGLINFQVAAYTVLHKREAATLAAILISVAAAMLWMLLTRKKGSDLLCVSALAVISLLPVYHRFYDAELLIFPLAWSLPSAWRAGALGSQLRAIARAVFFVIVLVFLAPGGSALQQMQLAGHFATVKNTWWWNRLVLPHESWSVLLLTVLLLLAMARADGAGRDRTTQHLS